MTTMFTAIPVTGTPAAVGLTVAGQQSHLVCRSLGLVPPAAARDIPPTLRRRGAAAGRRRRHTGLLTGTGTAFSGHHLLQRIVLVSGTERSSRAPQFD